jgi:hypothetical protein
MNADWGATLRAMIPELEAGVWDEQQLQNLIDDLDNRPDAILPRYVGLCQYVAFLCTKIDRAALGRRILYADLHWELTRTDAVPDVATTIANIQSVEELLGEKRSAEQIRQAALDGSYRSNKST